MYRGQGYGHSSQKLDTLHGKAQERSVVRAGSQFDPQKGTYGVHVQGAGNFGRTTSSQECIIPTYSERATPDTVELHTMAQNTTSIRKTVEIELYTAEAEPQKPTGI